MKYWLTFVFNVYFTVQRTEIPVTYWFDSSECHGTSKLPEIGKEKVDEEKFDGKDVKAKEQIAWDRFVNPFERHFCKVLKKKGAYERFDVRP